MYLYYYNSYDTFLKKNVFDYLVLCAKDMCVHQRLDSTVFCYGPALKFMFL